MLTAYFVIVVLSLALFSAIGALTIIWFNYSLDRLPKEKDGAFFCHSCSSLVGYRVNTHETIIAKFVSKEEASNPDNVIQFSVYQSDLK